MESHRVVSRDEWIEARKQLLAKEKDFTRLRDHAVYPGIIVIGIMMEEEKAFDLGRQGQSDNVIDAAVAPVNMLRVLLAIILRIDDK